MNLMWKCVQIKDELGQLCTYLLKQDKIAVLYRLHFIQCPCTFSLADEAAYVAVPLM
jgi:hypothetical protein